jgi:hypothetical protein
MAEPEERVEFVDYKEEKKEHKYFSFKELLSGSVLTRQIVVKQLPYVIFLTLLAIVYIGNRYHAERLVRETLSLQREIKELRAEAITTSARLMYISKQSEVVKLVQEKDLGLEESHTPPLKINMEEIPGD